eukprot:7195602-Pyramimonas_sp.AAC.1
MTGLDWTGLDWACVLPPRKSLKGLGSRGKRARNRDEVPPGLGYYTGLGSQVLGLGSWVSDLGSPELWVLSCGSQVLGIRSRVSGYQVSGLRSHPPWAPSLHSSMSSSSDPEMTICNPQLALAISDRRFQKRVV